MGFMRQGTEEKSENTREQAIPAVPKNAEENAKQYIIEQTLKLQRPKKKLVKRLGEDDSIERCLFQ
jgi:hypothetical protein